MLFPELEHVHDAEISWHHWCANIPVWKQGSQWHSCQKVDFRYLFTSFHGKRVFIQNNSRYLRSIRAQYQVSFDAGCQACATAWLPCDWGGFANTARAVCMSSTCITALCAEFDSRPLYNNIEQLC